MGANCERVDLAILGSELTTLLSGSPLLGK